MTKKFNKVEVKENRRYLRKNMPQAEVIIWSQIKNKQRLNSRFLRQFSIGKYILDFYCPYIKLAIEIDGDSHFKNKEKSVYDIIRENYLKQFGITILRFTNYDVYSSLNAVVLKIDEVISSKLIKEEIV
jgi:very-short-patch-repair endonuclease